MHAADEITQFRQWRRYMGFTQAEAAQFLGYGVTRVCMFDRGEADPPRVVEIIMRASEDPAFLKDLLHEKLRSHTAAGISPTAFA